MNSRHRVSDRFFFFFFFPSRFPTVWLSWPRALPSPPPHHTTTHSHMFQSNQNITFSRAKANFQICRRLRLERERERRLAGLPPPPLSLSATRQNKGRSQSDLERLLMHPGCPRLPVGVTLRAEAHTHALRSRRGVIGTNRGEMCGEMDVMLM